MNEFVSSIIHVEMKEENTVEIQPVTLLFTIILFCLLALILCIHCALH